MTREDSLLFKIAQLTEARSRLLHAQPTDMVAVQILNERIVDASAELSALSLPQKTLELSPEAAQRLQGAVAALRAAVDAGAGASEILAAATQLAQA
jgi:hypothetical protein